MHELYWFLIWRIYYILYNMASSSSRLLIFSQNSHFPVVLMAAKPRIHFYCYSYGEWEQLFISLLCTVKLTKFVMSSLFWLMSMDICIKAQFLWSLEQQTGILSINVCISVCENLWISRFAGAKNFISNITWNELY